MGSSTTGAGSDAVTDGDTAVASASGSSTSHASSATAASGDTTPEDTASDTDENCEGVCVGPVPDEWNGPVVQRTSDDGDDPGCGGLWPVPEGEMLHENVVAEPADCDCACSEVHAPVCEDSGVLFMYDDDTCQGNGLYGFADAVWNLSPGLNSPSADTPTASGQTWRLITTSDTPAACGSTAVLDQKPDLEHLGRVRLCQPQSLSQGTCAEGSCAPAVLAPFGNGSDICVWRDGEHECPETYPAASTYHRSASDHRGCGTCSCAPEGPACTEALVLLARPGQFVDAPEGVCTYASFAPVSFAFIEGTPLPDTCQVSSPSTPIGSVEVADPVTVCCRG